MVSVADHLPGVIFRLFRLSEFCTRLISLVPRSPLAPLTGVPWDASSPGPRRDLIRVLGEERPLADREV